MKNEVLTKFLVVLVCLIVEVACKDYYETLGVKRDDSKSTIKKAFRKLALKYHPDKTDRADAESLFREMVEAYEVLSNDEKRAQYDQGNTNFNYNTNEDFDYEEFYRKFDKAKADHLKAHYSAHQKAVKRAQKMAQAMGDGSFKGFDDDFFDDLFDDGDDVDTPNNSGPPSNKHVREYFNAEGKKCHEIVTKEGNSVSTHHICTEKMETSRKEIKENKENNNRNLENYDDRTEL